MTDKPKTFCTFAPCLINKTDMEKEYTFWVEDYPAEGKYNSIEEAVKAAQDAYDCKDEDALYCDDDGEIHSIVNVGIIEYLNIDRCASYIADTIQDDGFELQRCVDILNEGLYNLCPEARWEAEHNDVADSSLIRAYVKWKNKLIDDDILKQYVATWIKAVMPDVWSAIPLKHEYDLKQRKWLEN